MRPREGRGKEGGSIGEGLGEMGQERERSLRTCSDGEQPSSVLPT